jgi:hypothetical protein
MKIYDIEKKEKLEEKIIASASIKYESAISQVVEDGVINKETEHFKLSLSSDFSENDIKQMDLAYLETILVSTGWNRNDDIFLPEYTWKARATPINKKLNIEHNEDDIVGHMTGSYVLSNGFLIDNNTNEIPESFDIVTTAVLYKIWQKQENAERMNKILAEIDEGKWFVSMECLFSDFDYGIINPEGKSIILPRSEATAYLTKHLRIYGGEGQYEGHKVGRILKDFTFSGKGLVYNPANPRSIILKSSASFKDAEKAEKLNIGEKVMNEELLKVELQKVQTELAKVREDLMTSQSELKAIKSEEEKRQAEAVKLASESKDKTISELNSEVESLKASLAKKDEEFFSLSETLEKTNEIVKAKELELSKIEQERKTFARIQRLVEAGFEKENAESSVALYDAVSDENFNSIVETLTKAYMPYKEKEKEEKAKSESEKDKDMEKMKMEKEKAKKEVKAEASAETFEDTITEATVNSNVTETEGVKTALASWLSASIGLEK